MKKIILFLNLVLLSGAFAVALPSIASAEVASINKPVEKDFRISAYYSPLPNQSKYFKGNYKNEVLLNGPGKVTASGNSIYKGVVAAPRNIPFGTLIEVKDQGFYKVEDRGSAIVDNNKVRLDLWKGFGEEALTQALNWGMRDRKGWVYPKAVTELSPYYFNEDLELNSEGEAVRQLQKQLKAIGFYNHAVTGFYGPVTENAVYDFQVFRGIVPNREYLGAGRVGPGTRHRLNVLNKALELLNKNKEEANKERPPHEHYAELLDDFYTRTVSYGDVDYNVYILQQKLYKLGYFSWPRFTYQYKDATKKAVYNFQVAYGVVDNAEQTGAGVFGPATRAKLQEVLG
jgi:peptidoglycan hydrolase-like protein with peptidoglycan-binding domain/3D (Asp-Asp-Asp) domain-containing protein